MKTRRRPRWGYNRWRAEEKRMRNSPLAKMLRARISDRNPSKWNAFEVWVDRHFLGWALGTREYIDRVNLLHGIAIGAITHRLDVTEDGIRAVRLAP